MAEESTPQAEALMQLRSVAGGIDWQADHAHRAGAEATGRVIRALLTVLEGESTTGQVMRDWPGLVLEDAMPLRVAGGLHHLLLSGTDDRLDPVYAGEITDQREVDKLVMQMVAAHDEFLLPWLDGPPQTNEAGRSASIIAALSWLAQRLGGRFALNEIGASAGVNLMMGRYHYNLGGVHFGPSASPMLIAPDWDGPPPPEQVFSIVSARGCDRAPIGLTDTDAALRLKSYVWPEVTQRMARLDAAISLAHEAPPDLVQMDAADWVEQILTEPQAASSTCVLYHSIVWQYLGHERQARITAAMDKAGRSASRERSLAWIKLETNRETFRHEARVCYWTGRNAAGEGQWHFLGEAHPHGAWVRWLA